MAACRVENEKYKKKEKEDLHQLAKKFFLYEYTQVFFNEYFSYKAYNWTDW